VTRADESAPLDWPPGPDDLALIEVVDTATFDVVPVSETSALKAGDLDLLRRFQPERVPPPIAPSIPAQLRRTISPMMGSLLTAAGIVAIAGSAYLSFIGPHRPALITASASETAALNGNTSLPIAPTFEPMPLAPDASPQHIAADVDPSGATSAAASDKPMSPMSRPVRRQSSRAPVQSRATQLPRGPRAMAAAALTSTPTMRATKPQAHELHWLKPSTEVAKAAPTPVATTADLRAARDLPTMAPLTTSPATTTPETAPVAVRTAAVHEPLDKLEQQQVRATLKQYEQAYERLDADAVRAVWPSVDTRALARAFHDLKSQALVFDSCDVSLATARAASVACRGRATYETRAGEQSARTEHLEWTFQLQKMNEEWRIVKAVTR
jgi:hypothetical protein